MLSGKTLRFIILFAALYVCAEATAYAGACNSIAISAQTASGGATVTGSNGVFSVSLGSVNGLGIFTPAPGVSVSKSSSGATYTTPVTIQVTYSNCSGGLFFTIKGYQDSTTSSASQTAARAGSAAAAVTTVPTSQASATTISTPTNNGNGTINITRYVGVFVSNANGASNVTGALAPKFIFQFVAQ